MIRAIAPLLEDDFGVGPAFVAQFAFDEVRQPAVHQVLRNRPGVGDELDAAPPDRGVRPLLDHPVIPRQRSGTSLRHHRNVLDQQARVARSGSIRVLRGSRRADVVEQKRHLNCPPQRPGVENGPLIHRTIEHTVT